MVGKIEKWKDKKLWENGKVGDIKNLVFPYLCLVWGVEKWRNGKLFCLVEIKNERMKNKVDINLSLCLY